MHLSPIRTVAVHRYVTPLREGGSLPAIAEADDGFLYVLKFRGAGQGIKALIAEILGARLAMALSLPVPELVFAHVDEAFGKTEPDEEIQDLLKASTGINIGLHYLSGALTFDPAATAIDPLLASKIVWLDAFIMNVDRTIKNTNLLVFNRSLWLIDHGAAFYFHHNIPDDIHSAAQNRFALIKNHVLLPYASALLEADDRAHQQLSNAVLDSIVQELPDTFLEKAQVSKELYSSFLKERFKHSSIFVKQAIDARNEII